MSRVRLLFAVLIVGSLLMTATPAMAAPPTWAGGSGCSQFYVVHWGDNLYRIAMYFGTTYWNLMQLNGLSNPNFIYAGQTLCVRAGAPAPTGFRYVVQPGDTLLSIARHFGLNVWTLAAANHIFNLNRIYAGQCLFIPFH
ncbi:MAG: LysM peptidoglycan-binding domain-containing protein [Rudaea sp.]